MNAADGLFVLVVIVLVVNQYQHLRFVKLYERLQEEYWRLLHRDDDDDSNDDPDNEPPAPRVNYRYKEITP